MIGAWSAMLISVFIVPVVHLQTTTILHRLNIWWDILRMACISSASPSSRNGKAVLRADRHISQFVDLLRQHCCTFWSFLLLQNSRHKQVFQYDHFFPGRTGFLLQTFFSKETPTKSPALDVLWTSGFFSSLFSDVWQTSGYCSSLFSRFFPSFQ